MINRQRQQGLSLIEMLLVVALIGIIGVYLADLMQSKNETDAIQNTTKQMASLLQIASVYKTSVGTWPETPQDLINANYATNLTFCSTWAGSGQWDNMDGSTPSNADCPNKAVYNISNGIPADSASGSSSEVPQDGGNLFAVSVQLPSQTLAQRVGASLPSARIIPASSTVYTYTTGHPLATTAKKAGWPVNGGLVNGAGDAGTQGAPKCKGGFPGDDSITRNIYLPDCPDGYEGHYIRFPSHYTGDIKNSVYNQLDGWSDCEYSNLRYVPFLGESGLVISNPASNSPYMQMSSYNPEYSENVSGYAFSAFFLTFCLPNGQWESQPGSSDWETAGESVSNNYGQCDATWAGSDGYNQGDNVLTCGQTIWGAMEGNYD